MIDFRNPYTPGAGMMPKYLAGRNTELESAEQRLLAMPKRPIRPSAFASMRSSMPQRRNLRP